MRLTSSGIGVGVVIAVALGALALGGCRATAYADEPVGYVEVSSAPVDVEVYPHTYYGGRQVYYVRDRWMYRDGGRWLYYRQEPPELYRQRTYIQQAPPAYPQGRHPYPQSYPRSYPQPYGRPPPASAPPAVRVQ
jgi:hypothetical protein